MEVIIQSFPEISAFIICIILIELGVKLSNLKKEVIYEVKILGNEEPIKKIRTNYIKKKVLKWSIIAGTSIAILLFVGYEIGKLF